MLRGRALVITCLVVQVTAKKFRSGAGIQQHIAYIIFISLFMVVFISMGIKKGLSFEKPCAYIVLTDSFPDRSRTHHTAHHAVEVVGNRRKYCVHINLYWEAKILSFFA
jgi:hypothetical protein